MPKRANRPNLDDVLRPMTMTCAKCGATATAYPYPMPQGTLVCPCSSPAWLEDFVTFATKDLRASYGLSPEW